MDIFLRILLSLSKYLKAQISNVSGASRYLNTCMCDDDDRYVCVNIARSIAGEENFQHINAFFALY